ncbi:cytochrome C oxidase subunit IV family protein [Myroides ceti]|uniref:Cytochrome C oxidase subunit IV family protein n=1 Tax=Paenimyroides ceti TaxID=395087 RepID=A0ABT8CUA3_9FLAO|nr:cytochrome C oxidase subunit IV family protein [Paenimyroides ceti]MDN3708088.1 cytochrome C oxidase subunit IV family protein [Paenimyroides ceti]
MAADTHGSNVKRIWTVFVILSLITIVEVVLGIFKPDFLFHPTFLHLSLLNWIFILLTIWKAYYIMWAFMHLEGEKANFRWSIVGTMIFLMLYMAALILIEGDYIYDVFHNSSYRWIF